MSAPPPSAPALLIAANVCRRGLDRDTAGVLYIRREGLERAARLRGADVLVLAAALLALDARCRTKLVDLEPWERALNKAEAALARCRKRR